MNAPLLRHLKAEFGMDGKSTTHILKELSRELDKLDLRNNQLLYVLLEGSMFWQLRQVMRIEQWRHKYGKYLLHWLDVLGDIDALCSLATFAGNHPAYTYPNEVQVRFKAWNKECLPNKSRSKEYLWAGFVNSFPSSKGS